MDGGARIAEVLLTYKFTISTLVVDSETMPNQTSSRCALAVIEVFIPGRESRDVRES
jgi:hypothetical protein